MLLSADMHFSEIERKRDGNINGNNYVRVNWVFAAVVKRHRFVGRTITEIEVWCDEILPISHISHTIS
jgi:hypothetical protein